MRNPVHTSPHSKLLPLISALAVVAAAQLNADDDALIATQPAPTEVIKQAPDKEAKPANKDAKKKETSRLVRLDHPIVYPTIYPNPLAFNMRWVAITNKTFEDVRALAARQRAAAQRAAAVRRPPANVVVQNAVQQQMRKLLEPILFAELSFAARVTDLNRDERQKLSADGKTWFEKFLVDFIKKQDPNQQQMLLQGMQGVWFGNQRQQVESPRDAIRAGVAKLVKDTLPKEKLAIYTGECRKRDEFARKASVDNLVERIDEKVKLSPDQWKKLTKSLNDHWDKNRDPQLETFAMNESMWPGAPDQWVLPELSPAQQAVLKRVNATGGQMFFNGGVFGQMIGGDVEVFNDIDGDANPETAQPPADAAAEKAEAE